MVNSPSQGERGAGPDGRLWRSAILCGLGLGTLAGLAEVCWAYCLTYLFAGRSYYLATDELWPFALVAMAVDAVLVTAGALLVAAIISLIRAVWARARRFTRWAFVCRWVVLTATGSGLFTYWLYSYIMTSRDVLRRPLAAAAVVAMGIVSYGVWRSLEVLQRRVHRATPLALWALAAIMLSLFATLRFRAYGDRYAPRLASPPARGATGPNIVLFTLDTLRADFVGCYGRRKIETPALDALAADGVLFEYAIAQAPHTTPSHCSIMTSRYPGDHGALNGVAMRPDLPTIAELLASQGYRTAAFVSSTTTRSMDTGLHRGFERYQDSLVSWSTLFGRDEWQQLAVSQTLDVFAAGTYIDGDVVGDRALDWLRGRPEGPFFTWLHYFDPHGPYGSPGRFARMYVGQFDPALPGVEAQERYAEDVSFVDAEVGRIVAELKSQGLYDEALIIVTSDHGQAFGERHGAIVDIAHGNYLYDTTQWVPLIIKLPGGEQAGRRVPDQVQLVDIAPTVLALADLPIPASYAGSSLVALAGGGTRDLADQIAYAQTVGLPRRAGSRDAKKERRLVAIRTPQLKYICNYRGENAELYDLVTDPAETTNVVQHHLQQAVEYRDRLIALLVPATPDGVTEVDDRVIRELEALGYIGGDED